MADTASDGKITRDEIEAKYGSAGPAKNPFVTALGVLAIIALAVGVLLFALASSLAGGSYESADAAITILAITPGVFTFGGLSLLLWLTVSALRWAPVAKRPS